LHEGSKYESGMSSNIGKIAIPVFVNFMEDSDLLIFEKNLTTIEYISVIRRTTATCITWKNWISTEITLGRTITPYSR
jgi:hypothetical protein